MRAAASPTTDEVDALLAAWTRERPDLDTSPMQIWSRIARLSQLLDEARAAAYSAQELQVWEFDVLAALRRAGGSYELSPGELTRQTHVTSGTMTNRVDRLVARDLVSRTTNPHDGRGVLVKLTAEGRRRVDAALSDLVTAEAALAEGLTDRQREGLAAVLRKLLISTEN